MELEVEETGPVERRLHIRVPTTDVDAAFDRVYREIGRSARLKGFRPGRVPRAVLEQYFGARARAEVLERLVQDSLPRAVEEGQLAVVGEPRLEPEAEPRPGAPFEYGARVEIRPEIELKKAKGLEVRRPQLPIPEEDPVESYLEELRASHAQLIEEAEDRVAARGHVAVLDHEATLEGGPLAGGSGTEVTLEIGSGRSLPGFEAQIEGMRVGEERAFELELPDDFPQEDARGKTAQFRVRLVGLKRKEFPALDDDFAKDVSEFETLEAMREDARVKLEQGRGAEEQRRIREAVIDRVIEENPFAVPPSLVQRQLEMRMARAVATLRERVPAPELERLVAQWREEWRASAERDVRLALLVPEIAKAEDIEVDDDAVDAKLREIAEESGEAVGRLKRRYREQGLLEALHGGLLEERVVEFLVAEATLSDV